MKLYTEEQVKEAYKIGLGKGFANITIEDLKPIELPSDEEIENNAYTDRRVEDLEYHEQIGFEIGAKWMREQILNQNK